MQRHHLLAGTAIALVMCAVPAIAQQKSEDKAGTAQTQSETKEQGSPQKGTSQRKAEPKNEQGATRGESTEKGAQHKEQGKEKAAQGKEKATQGKEKAAQGKEQSKEKGAQTQEKSGKGTAQAPSKEQDNKGSAQTTSPGEKQGKGTAQTPSKDKGTAQAPGKEQDKMGAGQASKDRTGKENAQKEPKGGGTQKSTERSSSGERVQLSEQQRTNVHQTLTKESNLNRATNVNISVSVGTRVPRSVRLARLPASIVSIVPAYRSYEYVVVNDEICIVDPKTYEIVEVIAASGPGRTARVDSHGGQSALVLTQEEKAIVLRSVDTDRGNSTLGLGTLTEGSSVPRGANLHAFPDTVVQQVPKLKGHKFFTAENRVAIVDTQSDKVQLVLEDKR